jgi:hypothetical protein
MSVDAMIEAMTTALVHGDKVEIRGFGNFTVRQREARKAWWKCRQSECLALSLERSLRRWWSIAKPLS